MLQLESIQQDLHNLGLHADTAEVKAAETRLHKISLRAVFCTSPCWGQFLVHNLVEGGCGAQGIARDGPDDVAAAAETVPRD